MIVDGRGTPTLTRAIGPPSPSNRHSHVCTPIHPHPDGGDPAVDQQRRLADSPTNGCRVQDPTA